jgi:hypothetical protein
VCESVSEDAADNGVQAGRADHVWCADQTGEWVSECDSVTVWLCDSVTVCTQCDSVYTVCEWVRVLVCVRVRVSDWVINSIEVWKH